MLKVQQIQRDAFATLITVGPLLHVKRTDVCWHTNRCFIPLIRTFYGYEFNQPLTAIQSSDVFPGLELYIGEFGNESIRSLPI
jgi:hypothetical protein